MITVKTTINADRQSVWQLWTHPEHIVNWNFAADEWHCPGAVNDLQPGGKFSWRMEAKDGTMGFDYAGVYEKIEEFSYIQKRLDDGRQVNITFVERDSQTEVIETFEPENVNDPDLQRQGWQAILDNFKQYAESV